jgi:ABC-type uncharacterized transport system ATPase subunit
LENIHIENTKDKDIYIKLTDNQNITHVIKQLLQHEIEIEEIHEILPSIHEIFINQVNKNKINAE